MMVSPGSSAFLVLISLVTGVADAIRTLKEGPMTDAEGREYKSVSLDNSKPKFSDRSTIRVECTDASMIIFIQADFYKTGRLASPKELFLGDAEYSKNRQCQAVPAGEDEYVIEADLQGCGSKLTISDDDVIYSNKLIFSPAAYHGITRMTEAVVPVSCHYKRKHTVSSSTHQQKLQQKPLMFSTSAKFPAGGSPFSLKLMADDWSDEMFSNTFYLGDPLHLKASYSGSDSRKLFIDSCVATVTSDVKSVPRYYIIENHGCFIDSKDGGLNSFFLPRSKADMLQFQFDAFLFHNELRNTVYITCKLKATQDLMNNSAVSKACSYVNSRWMNVDGNDNLCWCCNRVCRSRLPRDEMVCDTLTLGPLVIFPKK